MTKSQKQKVFFIAALVVLCCAILAPTFLKEDTLPKSWPFAPINLGLDLKGGSYLVLGVKTEEAVVSQLRSIGSSIKAELKSDGVKGLRVRPIGTNRLEFSLLGDRHLKKLQDLVAKDFNELQPVDSQLGQRRVTLLYEIGQKKIAEIERSAVEQAIETIRNRVDQYGVSEPVIQRVGEKRIMVQLPNVTNMDYVKRTIGSVAKLEFRLVPRPDAISDGNTIEIRNRDGGGNLIVEDEVLMTGDVINTANVEVNPQTNELSVSLRFKSVGKKMFDRITSENVGRQLAIILDGVAQSAPVIRDRISGGVAQITGGFSSQDAHHLAIVLRSGALPAPLTWEEERTVGASLGADSIGKGIYSMVIGSIIVIIFMIIYYKKAGVLAVTCLALNVIFLLGLLALLKATLTLPGIAGLVLTIGMAVDANVIIFERIREELRVGAAARGAVEGGFSKAHWTILDANITTLLTGIILYGFGTGPIKGFAVTLCLGIITSVFSALVVTKIGFEVLKLRNSKGELSI